MPRPTQNPSYGSVDFADNNAAGPAPTGSPPSRSATATGRVTSKRAPPGAVGGPYGAVHLGHDPPADAEPQSRSLTVRLGGGELNSCGRMCDGMPGPLSATAICSLSPSAPGSPCGRSGTGTRSSRGWCRDTTMRRRRVAIWSTTRRVPRSSRRRRARRSRARRAPGTRRRTSSCRHPRHRRPATTGSSAGHHW